MKLLQNFTYEVFKSRFEKVHLRLICYRNSPKLMKYFNKYGRWLILWNQSRQNDQLHVFWGVFWKKNSKIYWNEMNLVSFSFGSMLVVRHPMVIILLFWDVSSEIKKNIVSVQNDVGLKRSISVIKRFSMTWLTSCVFVCFVVFMKSSILFISPNRVVLVHLVIFFIILAAIVNGYLAFTLIILWKLCSSLLLSVNVQSLLKQTAVSVKR